MGYPDKSHVSGNTGKCKWDKKETAKVTGYKYAVPECKRGACKNQDEDALAAALAAKGPISICVHGGGNGWQVYKKGVFSKKCSGAAAELDHCVQLVGYDKSGPTPYWIVRNSWNTDWGIDGYMHLKMDRISVASQMMLPSPRWLQAPSSLRCERTFVKAMTARVFFDRVVELLVYNLGKTRVISRVNS